MGIYRELLGRKNGIGKELEIVRTEIDCAARNPFTQSLCDSVEESINNEIHGLENNIVKVKLRNAELRQKNELLQDTIQHWKQELVKRNKNVEDMNKELERYTEYRNSIQKSISRQSLSVPQTTMSASTSLSYGNTRRVLNSSMVSERNSSRFSNRSNNNSMIIE